MCKKEKKKSMRVYVTLLASALIIIMAPVLTVAGNLEPTAPPGSTMKTLDEIPPTWNKVLDSSNGEPDGCNSSRFECGDLGVLDKETGLVWARNANHGYMNWEEAIDYCANVVVSWAKKGWRLPTREELASLVEDGVTNPSLPSGHPFQDVQNDFYWSSTPHVSIIEYAWGVYMSNGLVHRVGKSTNHYVWPVRGGND